jgi:hypothetical protein
VPVFGPETFFAAALAVVEAAFFIPAAFLAVVLEADATFAAFAFAAGVALAFGATFGFLGIIVNSSSFPQ